MSDEKQDVVEEEEKTIDKHNWGAADLEKMVEENAEKDDLRTDGAGNVDHLKVDITKSISLRAEDVKLLIDEFELKRGQAERYLIKHRGDISGALRELIGS